MTTTIGTTINQSPTITLLAGEEISKAPGKAVTVSNGKVVLATAGSNAIGLVPLSEDETIAKDADVTIQIKDIGAWVAAEAIAVGDELASNGYGCAVKAATGNFIIGIATTAAAAAGTIIRAQITKSGYKA